MVHNLQLSASNPEDNWIIPEMGIDGKQVSYLTVIGSLMYLMLGTCPDIAYAVGALSHFSAKPSHMHWEAAKRVLIVLESPVLRTSKRLGPDRTTTNQDRN